MSADQMPPEIDAPQGPPKLPASITEAQQELLRAVISAAKKANTADDARDVREHGQGAYALMQAYVLADPMLIAPQGVPPEVLARAQPTPEPASEETPDAATGE